MGVFSSGLLFLLIHSLSGGRSVILFVKSEDLHQVLKSTLINLVPLSEITILGTPNHAKTAKRHFLTVRVVRSLVGKNSIQPLPPSTATNMFRCFWFGLKPYVWIRSHTSASGHFEIVCHKRWSVLLKISHLETSRSKFYDMPGHQINLLKRWSVFLKISHLETSRSTFYDMPGHQINILRGHQINILLPVILEAPCADRP